MPMNRNSIKQAGGIALSTLLLLAVIVGAAGAGMWQIQDRWQGKYSSLEDSKIKLETNEQDLQDEVQKLNGQLDSLQASYDAVCDSQHSSDSSALISHWTYLSAASSWSFFFFADMISPPWSGQNLRSCSA